MCCCCGGGGGRINSRAYAQALGSRTPPRSPSRFRSKSKRISHIKVDAKTRQLQDTGFKAWDQSFFGEFNGFRKGKSRQRASQGSDVSRRSNRGSNGSFRSMTPKNHWPKPLPQSMLVGKKSREKPAQSPTFRGKIRASKAGLNGMAETAGSLAERGRQVSEAGTKAFSGWADAGRQWIANKRPTRG
ncbi:hypothetical protein FDENT_12043 [Fusarium denticulatum]|uniref:Uncharacterized protein n=1 Tax=Fusarium denticulatum TaxID=48507 RepID=A0A8H5T8R7_9HYPO|nr:hypothetical protein FDENT_12043 [Fusarium denticulatum]